MSVQPDHRRAAAGRGSGELPRLPVDGCSTGEGPAALISSTGTIEYTGHATVWFGGGNNSGGRTEGGFTLTFHGSGTAGTISIRADQHSTTNNGGSPTSNVFNATITCS